LHDDYNASSNFSVVKTSFSVVNYPQRLIISFAKNKLRKATSLDGI